MIRFYSKKKKKAILFKLWASTQTHQISRQASTTARNVVKVQPKRPGRIGLNRDDVDASFGNYLNRNFISLLSLSRFATTLKFFVITEEHTRAYESLSQAPLKTFNLRSLAHLSEYEMA